MRLAYVSFVIRRVFNNLKELVWTHVLTSGIMAMTLVIFGGFLIIQENLHGLLRGWRNQIQIFAYLDDHLNPARLKVLLEEIRSFPEVESARFVSSAEAWENFKKGLGAQSDILEGLQQNILPSSLEIALRRSNRDRPSSALVVKRLREIKGISDVDYPEEWADKLGLLLLGVQWAKWLLGGFLFITTLLIVGSTVRLAILARQEEIEIMQWVGAPRGLIQAPFVVEGMIQGLAGAALSVIFLWALFVFVRDQLPSSFEAFAARGQLRFLDPGGISLLLFLGWAMGAGGSQISLRRFFKGRLR